MIAIHDFDHIIDTLRQIYNDCGEVTTYDVTQMIKSDESPSSFIRRMKQAGRELPPIISRGAYEVKAQQQAAELRAMAQPDGLTRRDVEIYFNQRGKRLDQRLARFAARGIELPEIIDSSQRTIGFTTSEPEAPEIKKTVSDALDPDACLSVAAVVVMAAVEDIKAGRDVPRNLAFLAGRRGQLFLSELGISYDALLGALEDCE
jgi:hypothetical protein